MDIGYIFNPFTLLALNRLPLAMAYHYQPLLIWHLYLFGTALWHGPLARLAGPLAQCQFSVHHGTLC